MFALPFAVLSLLASSAFAKTCTRTYKVKVGDTCDSISASQKSSTYQLMESNDQINDYCTNLDDSMTLCLGYEGLDCTTTYVVKAGDYCDLVSHNAGINSTMLWTNNPQINEGCTNLYIGEVLCVSGNSYAYPAYTPPAPPAVVSSTVVVTSGTTTPAAPVVTVTSSTTPAVNAAAVTTSTSTTASTTPPAVPNNAVVEDDGEEEEECEDDGTY